MDGDNPMSDLRDRINRNLADGLYIGAGIEERQEGTIVLPGVAWPEKAVAAQQAKYALSLGDDLRADEHLLDSYNEQKNKS